MKKIIIGFGTRPEVIKLAPVVKALDQAGFNAITVHTGQHDELASDMLQLFGIKPSYDLKAMRPNQDLFDLTSFLLPELKRVYSLERPDAVIVQGDTTSSYLSALAAFYLQIPVFHIEAGLRSHNLYNPFPEEMNRKQISVISTGHFVPTELAKDNLLAEGYSEDSIWITGNTIVDALHRIMDSEAYKKEPTPTFDTDKMILVTSHRRENRGKPLEYIMTALLQILEQNQNVTIVFPAHPSPAVQEIVKSSRFQHPRLSILPPTGYMPFLKLLNSADLVLTDSGGIQEECAALGKNVLVLRETTERQELVHSGFTKLLGSNVNLIVNEANAALNANNMLVAQSIYGDGNAAIKIVELLKTQL